MLYSSRERTCITRCNFGRVSRSGLCDRTRYVCANYRLHYSPSRFGIGCTRPYIRLMHGPWIFISFQLGTILQYHRHKCGSTCQQPWQFYLCKTVFSLPVYLQCRVSPVVADERCFPATRNLITKHHYVTLCNVKDTKDESEKSIGNFKSPARTGARCVENTHKGYCPENVCAGGV